MVSHLEHLQLSILYQFYSPSADPVHLLDCLEACHSHLALQWVVASGDSVLLGEVLFEVGALHNDWDQGVGQEEEDPVIRISYAYDHHQQLTHTTNKILLSEV